MGIIRKLKNPFTGKVIFPETKTRSIYDDEGGRLDRILRASCMSTDEEEYSGVEPRDADRLGGHEAEYFAKQSEVDELNTSLTNIDNRLSSLENQKVYKNLDLKDTSYYQKPYLVLKQCIENGTICSKNRKVTSYEGIIHAGAIFHYYGYIAIDNDYSSFIIHCYSTDMHYHFIQRQKSYTYTTVSHSSPVTI